MDRRQFFKAGVATLGLVATGQVVSSEPTGQDLLNKNQSCVRLQRYEKYRKMICDNPGLFPIKSLKKSAIEVYHEIGYSQGLTASKIWSIAADLAVHGDYFATLTHHMPYSGGVKIGKQGEWVNYYMPSVYMKTLAEHIYRIETITGKLLEFQWSKSGPDYEALIYPIDSQKGLETKVCRYFPDQVVHMRNLDFSVKGFYPYGCSVIEHYDEKLFKENLSAGIIELSGRLNNCVECGNNGIYGWR